MEKLRASNNPFLATMWWRVERPYHMLSDQAVVMRLLLLSASDTAMECHDCVLFQRGCKESLSAWMQTIKQAHPENCQTFHKLALGLTWVPVCFRDQSFCVFGAGKSIESSSQRCVCGQSCIARALGAMMRMLLIWLPVFSF